MLKCPHSNDLIIEDRFGVLYYFHNDGEECSQMGSFSIGVGTVLRTVRFNIEDEDAKRAAFMNSQFVRNDVYRSMKTMDADEMYECVKTYLRVRDEVVSIRGELANTFGRVVFQNVRVVNGFDIPVGGGIEPEIRIVELEEHEQDGIDRMLQASRRINSKRVPYA